MGFLDKLFGSYSDRELKRIYPIADAIEKLDAPYSKLSDAELRAKTDEFKGRLAQGETLDDILPEAFAAAREAAWRVLGMKPFRVQLIGGIVLHQGRIAEMKTGEGKTLVAVLPAYLNALAGEGVHIVTVNDYLARRDSEWMGKVHRFLGLSVGLIVHGLSAEERRRAYACDITYGTNNEMGFDYLRDNMALYKESMVQRGHAFAIVDEVDSILIDEARTPLIISGQGDESTDLYRQADDFVRRLKKQVYASVDEKEEESEDIDADYIVDEKARTATLTARGIAKAEQAFGLENYADIENATLTHHINQALKAHGIMKRDIDYIVKDGEIIIVDEFTGRLMLGRRYSEGLHQAIEAKEHVDVQKENKTLATITFQNYFRLYDKLSGMTGTAATEAEEFEAIYRLDIIEIPTNKPVIRIDDPDVVYKNETGKNRAIIEQIVRCHEKGQPVLVGTVSIEKSEYISSLLKKRGIPHTVLNAKYHEKEAEIVAQAGKLGAVTIATNMAGRGTDIMLGGNAEFLAKTDLRKAGFDDETIAEATGYADTEDENILAARALFAQRLAARGGYRMTCKKLEIHQWDEVQQRDRLIGCSLTGWQDMVNAVGLDHQAQCSLLEKLRDTAHQAAEEIARELGQKAPLLVTTVKPEGTLSLLPTVSSGIHYSHAPFYIRRVRINASDPLCKVCEELGYPVYPEVGQDAQNCRTKVVEFPVKAPKGRVKADVSAIEQLENYRMFMKHYVDHNCSITVHVRSHEWEAVEQWVWDNWDDIVALSFLSFDDSFYELMPYEEITEEEYNRRKNAMKAFEPFLIAKYEQEETDLDVGTSECPTAVCPNR